MYIMQKCRYPGRCQDAAAFNFDPLHPCSIFSTSVKYLTGYFPSVDIIYMTFYQRSTEYSIARYISAKTECKKFPKFRLQRPKALNFNQSRVDSLHWYRCFGKNLYRMTPTFYLLNAHQYSSFPSLNPPNISNIQMTPIPMKILKYWQLRYLRRKKLQQKLPSLAVSIMEICYCRPTYPSWHFASQGCGCASSVGGSCWHRSGEQSARIPKCCSQA